MKEFFGTLIIVILAFLAGLLLRRRITPSLVARKYHEGALRPSLAICLVG